MRTGDIPIQNGLNVTGEMITRLEKLNGLRAEARQGNQTLETVGHPLRPSVRVATRPGARVSLLLRAHARRGRSPSLLVLRTHSTPKQFLEVLFFGKDGSIKTPLKMFSRDGRSLAFHAVSRNALFLEVVGKHNRLYK